MFVISKKETTIPQGMDLKSIENLWIFILFDFQNWINVGRFPHILTRVFRPRLAN
jgi:hypothetical protein